MGHIYTKILLMFICNSNLMGHPVCYLATPPSGVGWASFSTSPPFLNLLPALVLFLYYIGFCALNQIYWNPHESSGLPNAMASLRSTSSHLSSLRSAAVAPIFQKGWTCPGHQLRGPRGGSSTAPAGPCF